MPKQIVKTSTGPLAIGPYSQAIRANGMIYVTGQIPIDPSTQELVGGGIVEQTERAIQNVQSILESANSSLEKIVRNVVFLRDMKDFAQMNEVYGRHFQAAPPARTTVAVTGLPKDCLIEIEASALE